MQRLVPLLLALFALMPAHAIEAPPVPVAFVNGMLLDGYEAEAIHQAIVVIEGNRIVAARPRHETPIPAGATVTDIGAKTILPGLIDAYVHVDLIRHGDYDRYYKFLGGMERLDDVMPIAAKQMLRAGVTSAIDLGTLLDILELRESIRANEIPGPRLTVSGPWITRVYLEGVPDEYQLAATNPRTSAPDCLCVSRFSPGPGPHDNAGVTARHGPPRLS